MVYINFLNSKEITSVNKKKIHFHFYNRFRKSLHMSEEKKVSGGICDLHSIRNDLLN